MEFKVYWKNRKPTPEGWTPEDDHELARKLAREARVVGFIRDGIRVEIDEFDLEYFQGKFDDLDFKR